MADDHAYKIQIAADLIRKHVACNEQVALYVARQLWEIWHDRVAVRDLEPGAVAQHFRERVVYDARDQPPQGWSDS